MFAFEYFDPVAPDPRTRNEHLSNLHVVAHSLRTLQQQMYARTEGNPLFRVALSPVSPAVLTDPTPGRKSAI